MRGPSMALSLIGALASCSYRRRKNVSHLLHCQKECKKSSECASFEWNLGVDFLLGPINSNWHESKWHRDHPEARCVLLNTAVDFVLPHYHYLCYNKVSSISFASHLLQQSQIYSRVCQS